MEVQWTTTGLKPYFNDFVAHERHAHGFEGSILASADLETGERAWKGGRYGRGQLLNAMTPGGVTHTIGTDLLADCLRRVFGLGFYVRIQHPPAAGDTDGPGELVRAVRNFRVLDSSPSRARLERRSTATRLAIAVATRASPIPQTS